MTTQADAPSENWLAFPAETTPPGRAGLIFETASYVVSGRMPSSADSVTSRVPSFPDSLSATTSPPCHESNSSAAVSRNAFARSYRCSCGRNPPRRKFSPVNASHEVTTFHAARPAER